MGNVVGYQSRPSACRDPAGQDGGKIGKEYVVASVWSVVRVNNCCGVATYGALGPAVSTFGGDVITLNCC